jgi:hypothetical protein
VVTRLLLPCTVNDGWTIASTYDVIRWIERNRINIPAHALLVTFDVAALYPNMPTQRTVELSVRRFARYHNINTSSPTARKLHDLFTFVLRSNYLQCHLDATPTATTPPTIFQQTNGITMGVSCAVPSANIFVGETFRPVFSKFNERPDCTVLTAGGFVDDGFAIVIPHSPASTALVQAELISALNSADSTLSLDITVSDTSVHFLDILISKGPRWNCNNYALDTAVYTKPDDINYHLYLPFATALPLPTRIGFIASEARRATCISSSLESALAFTERFAEHLLARGHPIDLITRQLTKVDYNLRHEYLAVIEEDSPPPLHCFSHQLTRRKLMDSRIVTCVLPFKPEFAHLQISKPLNTALKDHGIRVITAWKRGNARLGNILRMQYP